MARPFAPALLLLPLVALPALLRSKSKPRAGSEWEELGKRLIATSDPVLGMAAGSAPVQGPDLVWVLHPGWYFAWVPPAGFQRLHNFLLQHGARCKLRVSFGDDEWGHAFVFEVLGTGLLRWYLKSRPHSAPNQRNTTLDEVSHSVGLDTDATSQGFWTYYKWAATRAPLQIDEDGEIHDPIEDRDEPDDEKRGGEHYGGDHPIDHLHQIFCGWCGRGGWSYVRYADSPSPSGAHAIEWYRTDPGWTMVLPVSADASEGYRCPDHQFPPPPKRFGPPPPPDRVLHPGWYWFWVRPGAQEAAWRAMRVRYGPPIYVLYPRKTWRDVFVGSIELFEVVGADMVWSMPGTEPDRKLGMARPRPAPKRGETTLFDILAEAI